MDPVTAIGLVASIGQIVQAIYAYGSGVKEASREVARLRSELFGLKAAFEHIASNINGRFSALSLSESPEDKPSSERNSFEDNLKTSKLSRSNTVQSGSTGVTLVNDYPNDSDSNPFWSSMLDTEETAQTLDDAKALLVELQAALGTPPTSKAGRFLQKAMWPLKKSETSRIADQLERIKTYFVLATTSDSLNVCRQVFWEVRSMRRQIEDTAQQETSRALRQTVSSWLSPVDPYAMQDRIISNRHQGTGHWFLKHELAEWLQQSEAEKARVLWLRGKGGSGKSTLFSSCVEMLSQDHPTASLPAAFAFFYCTANDAGSQSPTNILGSFAVQICNREPSFWLAFEQYYSKILKEPGLYQKPPELPVLEDMFVDMCNQLSTVVLSLDAVNESSNVADVIDSLLRVLKRADSIRLMVTSTEETAIPLNLQWCPVRPVDMHLTSIAADIGIFIGASMDGIPNLRRLPQKLRTDIKYELLGKSDGSFRWATCQLDHIARQRSAKDIRQALNRVPATLEDTYISILCAVSKDDRHIVREYLKWLMFSMIPLLFDEANEAVVLTDEETVLDPEARLLETESLLQQMRSLIRLDHASRTISLAHESARIFLASSSIENSAASFFYLDPTQCQAEIAAKCVGYVSLPAFESGYCSPREVERRKLDFPLWRYSVRYWNLHVQIVSEMWKSTIPSNVLQRLTTFFSSSEANERGGQYGAWYQAAFPRTHASVWTTSPLYTASRERLLPVVRAILASEGRKNIERPGGRLGSTPLHVACAYGNTKIVEELLKAGADPHETNSRGECGLNWAFYYGHTDIVDLMLDFGADRDRIYKSTGLPGIPWAREDTEQAMVSRAWLTGKKI